MLASSQSVGGAVVWAEAVTTNSNSPTAIELMRRAGVARHGLRKDTALSPLGMTIPFVRGEKHRTVDGRARCKRRALGDVSYVWSRPIFRPAFHRGEACAARAPYPGARSVSRGAAQRR